MRTWLGVSLVLVLAACGSREKLAAPVVSPPSAPDAGGDMEQGTNTPKPPEAEWKTLVDLDQRLPKTPVAKPETFAKFVTGATFKTYRKAKKDCTGKNDAIISVDGGLQGAFTKKDAAETLYLISVVPCDEKSGARHTLLVLQGGHVNVNEDVAEHDLVEVKDVDQDGDNEILLVGGWPPQTKARLVDTEDGKLETLFDFGEIAKGSCDGGTATGDSAIIRYRKGGTSMEYKAEKRPKICAAAK